MGATWSPPPWLASEPERFEEAVFRRSLRVLRMVHELHKRGLQRIRIVPFMAPSGFTWRCMIMPARLVDARHGAWPRSDDDAREAEMADPPTLVARYTSAQDDAYFGWRDARTDSAARLATKFQERFPALCREGEGVDWPYAGWFVTILGAAEHGAFPIVCDDAGGLSWEHVYSIGPCKYPLTAPLPPAPPDADLGPTPVEER